ncbi:glycosyltransferase N-terminal domain-containing protein [Fibrobacter sp. UWB12]|uniref:glycosyltransferase N-terminal domain-containing protein n=1 Tax=Fibrobacter sp. UWB12 TaxID=1896203 RepID=UPI0009161DA2|nr:glycosyltransferase N-terminal domain-containing protein [Fibrobacter sp. UWB12]SHK87253.1 3-deoxy-D-manno-octulosonic-acid transferase [Fibrobacter sp. UWB12]
MFKVMDIAREALGSVAKVAAKVPVIEKKYHVKDRLRGPWPKGPFLWMHGASLGECKMLLNVAKYLKEDLSNCPRLLVTTQKVEVLSYIKESGADVAACIAPADTPTTMKYFISSVKPLGLILAENELWPGYLSSMLQISMRPSVAVISGRFHRAIPGMDYSAIGFASMQTGSDLSRFFSVSARANNSRMMIGGDWKLLPWVRSGENVSAPENPTVDTSFISMHIQEWASVYRMIESSIKRQEAVVLVPRRLSEVADFRKSLLNQEIIVVDWPKVQKGAVSIVSQFGVTKDVFAVSKSAVVGGSFARGLGVHDFWEPLQRGVATCVGPYAEGQKETVATLVREGVIAQLQSTDGFSQRNKPDVRLVQTFLAHESAKISDSYQQLIEFLKNLLK